MALEQGQGEARIHSRESWHLAQYFRRAALQFGDFLARHDWDEKVLCEARLRFPCKRLIQGLERRRGARSRAASRVQERNNDAQSVFRTPATSVADLCALPTADRAGGDLDRIMVLRGIGGRIRSCRLARARGEVGPHL